MRHAILTPVHFLRKSAALLSSRSSPPEPMESSSQLHGFEVLEPVEGAFLVRVPVNAQEGVHGVGWEGLHPDEQGAFESRPPRRRNELVAGRIALREALHLAGWAGHAPLLSLPQGGPSIPDGFTGSITHKDELALGLAARSVAGRTLGIDSEVLGDRERLSIASRVLRDGEAARWKEGGKLWRDLLVVFSTKEAIYKALHPHLCRYIGFEEAEIGESGSVRMFLRAGEGPFEVKSTNWWEGDRLIVVVEAWPR